MMCGEKTRIRLPTGCMKRICAKYNISKGYFYQIARKEKTHPLILAEIEIEMKAEEKKLARLRK